MQLLLLSPTMVRTLREQLFLLESRCKYDRISLTTPVRPLKRREFPLIAALAKLTMVSMTTLVKFRIFVAVSFLIRRDALMGSELFIEQMFAYFEDSELSLRIRASRYKIMYDPRSVVYHKHSSTTVEYSGFWRTQTAQNAIIFDHVRNAEGRDDKLKSKLSHLNHLYHWYGSQEKIFLSLNDNFT